MLTTKTIEYTDFFRQSDHHLKEAVHDNNSEQNEENNLVYKISSNTLWYVIGFCHTIYNLAFMIFDSIQTVSYFL